MAVLVLSAKTAAMEAIVVLLAPGAWVVTFTAAPIADGVNKPVLSRVATLTLLNCHFSSSPVDEVFKLLTVSTGSALALLLEIVAPAVPSASMLLLPVLVLLSVLALTMLLPNEKELPEVVTVQHFLNALPGRGYPGGAFGFAC